MQLVFFKWTLGFKQKSDVFELNFKKFTIFINSRAEPRREFMKSSFHNCSIFKFHCKFKYEWCWY